MNSKTYIVDIGKTKTKLLNGDHIDPVVTKIHIYELVSIKRRTENIICTELGLTKKSFRRKMKDMSFKTMVNKKINENYSELGLKNE
jgi:hypothetical protein